MTESSLLELFTLAVLVATGAGAVIKFTLIQFERRLDVRFNSIDQLLASYKKQADDYSESIKQLEREMTALKLDLANHYVRREDWIRLATTLEAKIDALAARMETLRLQNRGHHEQPRQS